MNFSFSLIQFFVIFIANCLEAKLNDTDNSMCLIPETYQVNTIVGRDVRKPKNEISFCWDISQFFRCSKTTYATERVYENKPVTRTRLVAKCCHGYVKNPSQNSTCVPFCWPPCHQGNCTAPDKCSCFPGYHGATCLLKCPSNHWGHYCSEECQCMNEATCDHVTGDCLCKPGWRGTRCELNLQICKYGYYGTNCQKKCNCPSQLCNPQTGTCISTTADVAPTETTTVGTAAIETTTKTTTEITTIGTTTSEIANNFNFTSSQNSTTEVFEEPTILTVATIKMTFPVGNNSLLPFKKNIFEERATTTTVTNLDETVTFDGSTLKSEKSSTVVFNDAKTETYSEVTIPEKQVKKTQLGATSKTEVTEGATQATKGTDSIEETTYEVKILKNVESDKKKSDNTPDFVESGNKENESKIIYKTKKNNRNETNENGLIESTPHGEYVTNSSKEIEIENGGDADKNYANERERNLHGFQFMPSLTVLFGVLIVIAIIGARWLISKHKKRKHKITKAANLKFTESVYTVNSFYEEPIDMSDFILHTKEPPPVLLTFKPVDT